MIPLRYVSVPPILLECPEKLGNRMPLDRAMAVMMLEPSTRYLPIDIARFCYSNARDLDKDEIKRRIANARRSYAELASLGINRSNPLLTGLEWMAQLRGNIHAVAGKMEELRTLMLAQPGVLFTIVGEQLVPHPDQSLDPYFRTPLERLSHQVEPESTAKPGPSAEPPLPESNKSEALTDLRPPLAIRQVARTRWFGRQSLLAIAFLLIGLPSAYGVYFFNLPRIALSDITEMGNPYDEPAFLMAKGKRYEVGDRVVFEGSVGVIKAIDREELQVGTETFQAPPLNFFGYRMTVDGNFVVFPGSPRGIAGNFWLSHSETLAEAKPGFLSWIGGWKYSNAKMCNLKDAADFFSKVSHKQIVIKDNVVLAISEGVQLEEFLPQCEEKGFSIKLHDSDKEMIWVD